jgi:RNA polymerase primary sigma factor
MKRTSLFPEEDFLNLYLNDIKKYKPVKSEEEIRLADEIKKGKKDALEKLVKANLRFVVSVARNYQNQGVSLSDLINEGNMGLIKAAKRFDGSKNFKFISYAVWWIRQAILQALAEQSRIVNVPLNRVGIIDRIGKTKERLEQRYGRTPTIEEVANELKLDLTHVNETVRVGNRHFSLDSPLDPSDETSHMDFLVDNQTERPDDRAAALSFKDTITKGLDMLKEREREILKLYYGLDGETPRTLDEIGERFSLTRERVRQVKENAIKKLKRETPKELKEAYMSQK